MNTKRMYFVSLLCHMLPPTRLFALKRALYSWCGVKTGNNVRIVSSACFQVGGNISIGENTWIGHDCLIVGGEANVTIGANCDIGPRVSLVTGSHRLGSIEGRAAGEGYSEAICLEDGVWLGASVTVLGGVTVGNGSMVAAGSLVRKNIPANVVVAGVPAKIVGKISSRETE